MKDYVTTQILSILGILAAACLSYSKFAQGNHGLGNIWASFVVMYVERLYKAYQKQKKEKP
ncbi:hypothetical protein LZ156_07375 [Streptococcus agalactiae]|nr:hypothetical protein [Streptococcus agalactiae]